VDSPLQTGAAVLGCDVRRTRPDRDCLAEDLSVDPFREDDPRPDPPKTIRAQDGAHVCARAHAEVNRWNPGVTQLVEVAPAEAQSCNDRPEAVPPESWHEQSKLVFRPPDGEI
jgi:hypothetical protein